MHTLVFKNVLFEAKPSTSKNHPAGFPLNLFICCATSPRGIKRIPLNTPIQAILGDFGASLLLSRAFFCALQTHFSGILVANEGRLGLWLALKRMLLQLLRCVTFFNFFHLMPAYY